MVDPVLTRKASYAVIYAGISLVLFLVAALPLGDAVAGWPEPQAVLAISMAWVLRRPDLLPTALVGAIALLADFLMMRPPGLSAALTILVIEFLRSRAHASREWPFLVEWLVIGVTVMAMLLGQRLVLAIMFVGQPSLGGQLQQALSTIVFYPVSVTLVVYALRLRRLGLVRSRREGRI